MQTTLPGAAGQLKATAKGEHEMDQVYERLREHLDSLPGGFPATEDGVELRILRRLFSPEEAQLALHLKMKLEPADTIAARAAMDPQKAAAMLKDMARKGLVFDIEAEGRPAVYMAAQFVVGIWEYHLNELDADFVKDMEAYLPALSSAAFGSIPQLRTIPVGKSIQTSLEVLPHEQAEELVRGQKKILVAPCICRREHQIQGGGVISCWRPA